MKIAIEKFTIKFSKSDFSTPKSNFLCSIIYGGKKPENRFSGFFLSVEIKFHRVILGKISSLFQEKERKAIEMRTDERLND